MAIDPDAVNPAPEASRLRRLGRRTRNAVARDVAAATPPDVEAAAKQVEKAASAVKAKPKARGDARRFVLENARVLLALALLVIGVVLVMLGWYGAANTNILTEQIPYLISGGLLGMSLIIVAGVVGSSASLSRENRDMHRDLPHTVATVEPLRSVPSPRRAPSDGSVYVVPGGHSYHLPGCPIIEGKRPQELTLDDATSSGYTTCKLCGPD